MPRLIGLSVCLVVCLVLILAISGPHSTLEAQNIAFAPKGLQNFKATIPPKPIPSVAFLDGAAKNRTLKDYLGRGVVLNFWATWCGPCVREMPHLDRLNALIRKNGIDVLVMSEDRNGAKLVEKFFQINGLKHLLPLRDPKGKLMRRLAVRGLPTTILIDSLGREVGRVVGPVEWDKPDVVAFIRRLLTPIQP